MNRFWTLLERSVIFSGLIALTMVFTASWCAVNQIPLPEYFSIPFGLVIGYFFSEKVRNSAQRGGGDVR